LKSTAVAVILFFGAAACSQSPGTGAIPGRLAPGAAGNTSAFKTLLTFDRSNGCNPYAGVAARHDVLYGTTTCGAHFSNGGVYSVTTGGTFRLLHSFTQDAHYPYAPVVILGKAMYGTSDGGGMHHQGTVYSLNLNGKERWVYSFEGQPDGASPYAGLVNVNGTLYGTTILGGTSTNCPYSGSGCGAVFKITTSGKESVVYSFKGGSDGERLWGGLVNLNGTLYGTTYEGGAGDGGTVFSVTPSGVEKVLHAFGGGSSDGGGPFGSLVALNGVLYGTTTYGGSNNYGTVFTITTSGQEKVVYSLGSGHQYDGMDPLAGLVAMNGKLFGTTSEGGNSSACSVTGCGTVFEVTTSGKESVLYSFQGGADGADPQSQLAAVNGVLYGTTLYGGSYDNYGTVFAVTP
jgi:uncharacterized repeat protein (TIGR03803 family)